MSCWPAAGPAPSIAPYRAMRTNFANCSASASRSIWRQMFTSTPKAAARSRSLTKSCGSLQNGARAAVKFALPLLMVSLAAQPGNGNDKNPPAHGQLVDSGTFGIFIGGRRVGTEKFRIVQTSNDLSTTTSEVTVDDGQTRAAQTSELEISSKGELVRYSWQEQAPGRAQATVEPGDAVLMQHVLLGPTDKPVSQKYLLPASTLILDDYFFVHREVLVWRYLASV